MDRFSQSNSSFQSLDPPSDRSKSITLSHAIDFLTSIRDVRRYLAIAITTVAYIGTALTSRVSNSVRETLSRTRLPNTRRVPLRALRPARNRRVRYQSELFFIDRESNPIGDVVVAVVADAANAPLSESANVNRKKHPILKLKHKSLTILFEFSR